MPKLSCMAILYNPNYPGVKPHFVRITAAAERFGITVRPIEMRSGADIEGAFNAILGDRPDAILSISDPGSRFGLPVHRTGPAPD